MQEQGRSATAALRRNVLTRMLRNMLQRWPAARLQSNSQGDFGVLLDGQTSLHVSIVGRLTDAEVRDLLALFANWVVVDPDKIRRTAHSGFSAMESVLRQPFSRQPDNLNGGDDLDGQ